MRHCTLHVTRRFIRRQNCWEIGSARTVHVMFRMIRGRFAAVSGAVRSQRMQDASGVILSGLHRMRRQYITATDAVCDSERSIIHTRRRGGLKVPELPAGRRGKKLYGERYSKALASDGGETE